MRYCLMVWWVVCMLAVPASVLAPVRASAEELGDFQRAYGNGHHDKHHDDDDDDDDDDGDLLGACLEGCAEGLADGCVDAIFSSSSSSNDFGSSSASVTVYHSAPAYTPPAVPSQATPGTRSTPVRQPAPSESHSTGYLKTPYAGGTDGYLLEFPGDREVRDLALRVGWLRHTVSDATEADIWYGKVHVSEAANLAFESLGYVESLPAGHPLGRHDALRFWSANANLQIPWDDTAWIELGAGVKAMRGRIVDEHGLNLRVGLELFPSRPLSLHLASEWTSILEQSLWDVSATVGVVFGPVELQAGWRGLRAPGGQWLDGPVWGAAVYF